MKMKPNIYRRVPFLGLLVVSAIFIVANFANAQGDLPALPVIGEGPIELPFPASISAAPEKVDIVISLTEKVYIPFITLPALPSNCNLNPQEQEIANLAIQNSEQKRPFMNCDPILAQVARERALDMGTRDYFSHTNPDGFGPNFLVRQAGYVLPSWYDTAVNANNIESIAAGYPTAASAWAGWMNSSAHRTHVLGLKDFWAAQTNYGIGYAYVPGSTYKHYWVFISAPPEE
jgi:uncharacterized protein YkwD